MIEWTKHHLHNSKIQEAQTACHGNYWNTTTDKCENALYKVDTVINRRVTSSD